jgi:type I restriction enzyme, S subunit
VNGYPRVPLEDLVLDERPKRGSTSGEVWNLNLDQVESDSGRVLTRVRVHPNKLGPSTYPFEAGTVLYSKLRPYLNKVVLADEPGYATTELVPLKCAEQKVLPAYLAYFLRSPEFLSFANTAVAGAKMPRMVMGEFWKYPAPLPPLPEQRRIAAILDKADALRAKRREVSAQLDRLAQAIFVEMFGDPVANEKGWARHPLGDLLTGIDSGWSPVCLERPADAHEWGVLKLGAVTSCVYDHRANKALPPGVEPDAGIEVKPGDLLFSRKNTYELVAACAYVESTRPRLMMSDLIFRLQVRTDAKLNKRFLHALLTHARKRTEVQKLAGGSAGSMPNISKAKLLGMQVELPPISLQQDFASRVERVGRTKAASDAAAIEADLLFSSLQRRAFKGEL